MKYTAILLGVLMSLLPARATTMEVRTEASGEVRLYAGDRQIGTNQIYVSLLENGTSVGQRDSGDRLTDVEIDREGDDLLITGRIPGVASLVERVTITETVARFTVSWKFETNVRAKLYSNFLLYGLQPPFETVAMEDVSGAKTYLAAEVAPDSGEKKLLRGEPKITVRQVDGPSFSIKSESPLFMSDARGCGGFLYIGIEPENPPEFTADETLKYTYEVSLLDK